MAELSGCISIKGAFFINSLEKERTYSRFYDKIITGLFSQNFRPDLDQDKDRLSFPCSNAFLTYRDVSTRGSIILQLAL